MTKSDIEWTERTLNLWVGCTIVSAGCTNCYAMKWAARLEAAGQHKQYAGTTKGSNAGAVWTGLVNVAPESRWQEAPRQHKPTLFFVNSMSDFFHPAEHLEEPRKRAIQMFRATQRHDYQILTKRPELVAEQLQRIDETLPGNVWLGTSVENQRVVDRVDHLRRVEARIRFLSVEPLIGPIDELDLAGIHWVIIGDESGPGARRTDLRWTRRVRDICVEQGVALFYKQAIVAGKKVSLPYLDGRQWIQMPVGQAHARPSLG
jgi:protein gp37